MKVGSLVELVDDNWTHRTATNFPVMNRVYTIRGFVNYPGHPVGVLLEEVKNPIGRFGYEYAFHVFRFRELLPPIKISIEEILEEIVER